MIKELDKLNNELENTDDQNTRDRMLEAREAFNSKYHNHFKREADKTTLFNQMNIEKPTKWFMNLASEKMTNDSPFNKLKKNGKKYEDREEMLDDANKYYSNIFKHKPRPAGVSIEAFLKNLKDKPEVLLKKLTEEEKSTADRKIEEKELKKTLDKVSAGKTPGIDGIEKEYLTRYWRLIGKTIADASGIFVEKEKLNTFMDRGLIKVIQKGDTTGETLNNWRPITLLSQIYKLISGVIAGRMKLLLQKLISGCQKAYQNTANIGEIILDIVESIAICNHHKKPACILLIDFSKAFDSISHDYIYETLRFFNFGDYFIKIVKTMLTGRTCTVMIDGFETKPFNIERGVPQGDTASPYLFILVLEILLIKFSSYSSLNFSTNASNAFSIGRMLMCMLWMSLVWMKQQFSVLSVLALRMSDHSPFPILLNHEQRSAFA